MSTWSYRIADLRTDATLDTFNDLTGVTFDDRIGQAGVFRGSLPVTSETTGNRARAALRAGRSVVHVYRNGRFWAGPYILWTVAPTWDEKGRVTITLSGAGLLSYLARRLLKTNLTYTSTDQFAIARALVDHMQSVRSEGNMGIQLGTGASGRLRDRSYAAGDRATYLDRLSELSAVDGGFEFRCVALGDGRVRTLILGYPRLGRAAAEQSFELPGKLKAGGIPADATGAATSFEGRGESTTNDDGTDVALICPPVVREDLLAAGFPLIDRLDDYQGVIEVGTLTAHATANAAQLGGYVELPDLTTSLPDDDSLTFGNLGDPIKLKILNKMWPLAAGAPTLARTDRLVGMTITPGTKQAPGDKAGLILTGSA